MSEIVRFQLARRVERREPHDSTLLRLFDNPADVDPLFPRSDSEGNAVQGVDERDRHRQLELDFQPGASCLLSCSARLVCAGQATGSCLKCYGTS
jgi:hypothetical protein